ncbi:neural cell adhesion molecule 2-like isoform X1 [Euwallacea fornicatus]|uniref:neural cell adhesion molecule 2-like isoform X1 n=1 Tax=Euwallacea fornicatus TaxID=995702 RepID=UPI00338EB282
MGVKMILAWVFLGTFCPLSLGFSQGLTKTIYLQHTESHHQITRATTGATLSTLALVGGTALLPCDLTSSMPNDSVELVVWYKDEHTPIYSYDVRDPYKAKPKHWKDKVIQSRGFYMMISEPSTLSIDNVVEEDEGEYRCRIDYSKSPTKNLRVRLNVMVPPSPPTIYDEKGNEVKQLAGPYEEGQDVKLNCMVKGGKPKPNIKWWFEGKLLETTPSYNPYENLYSNQLTIYNLQRSHLHATFTCQATNNNISQPLSATTSLDIHFRPVAVEILSSNQPFSADRKYEIPCNTFGSRPAAKISWHLDGKELRGPKYNISIATSEDDNSTTSTLTLLLTRLHNGRTLICKAVNPKVKTGALESSLKLNVFYVPIIDLVWGSNLNPDDIEEGDDVYFVCNVTANPHAYKIVWKFNNQVMQGNQMVIKSSGDLNLQAVNRSQVGNYSCVASNVEGDGESNVIQLKVMYKPLCNKNQKFLYGVAKHEKANILCEVESYPPPSKFTWSFNHSEEVKEVSITPETFNPNDIIYSSNFSFTPVSDLDYGTVMCWASNFPGKQEEPCIFHVIGAGKPDPLHNCSIVNRTNDSLEVECTEGFDGGLPQYFLLEVYDGKTNAIQSNVSEKFPLFIVTGLDPGKELKMLIYAANSKGRSIPVPLEGFTLKVAEKQTVLSLGTRDQMELAPVLGILVGIVAALLFITVIILGALKIHQARRDGSRALRPRFLAVKDKVTLPLRSESEDLFEKDDKNPDVVPSNKDSDYQLGSAAQTPGLNNSAISVSGHNEFASNTTVVSPVTTPSAMPSVTPLAEAYLARSRNFTSANTSTNEVVYAELQLARPNSLDPIKNGGQQYSSPAQQYATLRKGDDSTIYTKIDHNRRPPPPIPNSRTSPIISPVTAIFPTSKQGLYHREVVTVRTPLMGCQQESCV